MTDESQRIIRFYTDTHIARAIAAQLRLRGVEVVRCEEIGLAEASDQAYIAYAAQNGLAMVTHDQGFTGHHRAWLGQGNHHAGIFLITKDKDNIGMIVNTLTFWHEAIRDGAATLESDVDDQLIFLP
jgi:predicted nuclease of predicted toxin-antitoxin system